MADDLGYGRRLSGEEYDRRVVALYEGAPAMPTKAEDAAIRRQELDISIDYRLGVDFPAEKREAIWEIMQRVEKRRLWLGAKYGLRRLFSRQMDDEAPSGDVNALAGFMSDELAEVLNERELRAFLD